MCSCWLVFFWCFVIIGVILFDGLRMISLLFYFNVVGIVIDVVLKLFDLVNMMLCEELKDLLKYRSFDVFFLF